MWYDLLVLAILAYLALRGAARGLMSQLAGIASIVVCLVFAESISAAFGPYVSLQPPLNHWVVMFGAYLVCSFIAFGFARVLTDWMERAKLESFNQHLGAIFGLLKGIAVCLVMTFFLVTLSPAARDALSKSKSGYAAAYLMDRIHPVMPEKIKEALATYLQVYETGRAEEGQQAGTDSGGTTTGGTTTPWSPDQPFVPAPAQPESGAGQAIDRFLAQLPGTINADLRTLIGRSLQNTPPEQRAQAQEQFWNMLRQTRPEDLKDLQSQLLSNGGQTLGQAIATWMGSFVSPTAPRGSVPPPSGYQPPTPASPPAGSPPTSPPPVAGAPQSRQDQLLAEISRAFSSIHPVQLQVQADIRRRLTGLPPEVSQSVLEDWRRDLWAPQATDPDPGTDANATLESRIVRQLQARGYSVNQLSSELQDRLEGAMLR